MPLTSLLISTKPAKARMSVRELFEECLLKSVPALPYCDEHGRVTGRVTIKNVIQQSIITNHVAQFAHVLPPDMEALKDAEVKLRQVFNHDIEPYKQEPHATVTSDTSLGKALAVMEHHDTSYLFVVDDGKYLGTLTIGGIARHEIEAD